MYDVQCPQKKWNPFLAACALGICNDAKKIFNNDPSQILVKDADGCTALHASCLSGSVELVEWLLEAGADLTAINNMGETALHTAAKKGSLELSYLLVKTALEKKSHKDLTEEKEGGSSCDIVTLRNAQGRTALHVACEVGSLFVAQLFLEGLDGRAKVPLLDPSLQDKNGDNALNVAIHERHAVIVQYLLEKYPHLEESTSHQKEVLRSSRELRAIHAALIKRKSTRRKTCKLLSTLAKNGDTDGIDQLLREIPNKAEIVNWDSGGGRTALINAAASGRVRVVQYLLGIDGVQAMVNHKCRKGLNAVQWAVKNGHREVAQVLIEKGQCNTSVVTRRGEDLPALARYFGHVELARILARKHPATPTRPPRQESVSSSKSNKSYKSDSSVEPPKMSRLSSVVSVGENSDSSIYEDDLLSGWLNSLHLSKYETILKENGFDTLPLLSTVTEEDLEEMGFKKGHKRAFMLGQENLQKLEAPDLERLIQNPNMAPPNMESPGGDPNQDSNIERQPFLRQARKASSSDQSPIIEFKTPDSPESSKAYGPPLPGAFPSLSSLDPMIEGEKEQLKEIVFSELELLEVIGEGSFGVVRKGHWRGMEVAVKELKVSVGGVLGFRSDEEDLHHEAKLLSRVCNHSCVVQLVGVTFSPAASVITRYMPKGSVEDVLIKEKEDVEFSIVMRMAFEAAQGVLHLHREGVIHRDLAARNLLVDEHYHVRVSDFGFARIKDACASRGYTRTEMGPIKWTAPEAMRRKVYSESSDVFSFGVVLYEMVVKEPPWQGLENLDVAVRVCSGERMAIPVEVDTNISGLIKKCWCEEPSRRPKLPIVLIFLKSCSESPTSIHSIQLDEQQLPKKESAKGYYRLDANQNLISRGIHQTQQNDSQQHVYSAITFADVTADPSSSAVQSPNITSGPQKNERPSFFLQMNTEPPEKQVKGSGLYHSSFIRQSKHHHNHPTKLKEKGSCHTPHDTFTNKKSHPEASATQIAGGNFSQRNNEKTSANQQSNRIDHPHGSPVEQQQTVDGGEQKSQIREGGIVNGSSRNATTVGPRHHRHWKNSRQRGRRSINKKGRGR